MSRRGRVRPGPLRWTVLFSIWVHLGGLVAFALLDPPEPPPAEAAPLLVTRADPLAAVQHAGRRADPEPRGAADPSALAPMPREADAGGAVAELPDPRTEEVPPPPPEAPAPPPEDDEDWIRFVRTDAEDAVAEAPDSGLVSAHHTRSDAPRRAPVTSERRGPLRPTSEGPEDEDGHRTLLRRDGERDTRLGNPGGGGGGAGGVSVGQGAEGPAGVRLEGGAAAAASAGSSTAAPPRAARPAPRGDRDPGEGWWRPSVVRLVTPSPSEPTTAAAAAPAVTRGETRSLVERPGHRADAGGTDREHDQLALPDAPAEAAGIHRVEPPGTADPIAELRERLGFSPIDRDTLAPTPEWAGRDDDQGRADSSPQAVVDEVPIAWQTSLSTVGTPLGAWVQRAEELIAQRWQGWDLAPHDRAIGLQGQVTVRYLVQPSGRVSEVRVARSSGNATLDGMALEAIPDRLPRLPRDHADRPLHHQITLRYRNPLGTTGAQ